MMDSAGFGGQVRFSDLEFEYVYILLCNNGKTYVGHTRDIEERLARHRNGYVPATKNLRPVKLLTYLSFTDKYKAIAFEKYLKSGSGRAFLKKRLI
jgi:predicted GIY-YIG superfamily endonuclease